MSNAGQAAVILVSTLVGTALGNPGAGFKFGLVVSQFLFPTQLPTQKGPRLNDLATTQAQLGMPVGITYGTIDVPGQVMAIGCVEEVTRKEHVGGKGGPEQTIVNYDYFQTIAVGLCEGIICGVRRVWENGELKYDMREQQPTEDAEAYNARIEMSNAYSLTFTLYLGDEAQEPDPDLEIIFGTGMVPGFRGLAYIVFPNRQLLTEQALRHPSWRFEVVRGVGEPSVTAPTLINDPLDSFNVTRLLVDWAHNRVFTFDQVGDETQTGIRAFDLRSMTETQQVTFEQNGIGDPIAFYDATVGIDGFIYMSVTYHNSGPAELLRIDPITLMVVNQVPESLSRNQWIAETTIRVTGLGETADLLITVSALHNSFRVRRADTLVLKDEFEDGREEGQVCPGPYIANGISTAYGISYDEVSSGTSDGIDVMRWQCAFIIGVLGDITLTVDRDPLFTIDPSDIKSDWISIREVSGLVYDAEDGGLIFCVTGAATVGVTPTERRVVKLKSPNEIHDEDDDEISFIWNVEDTAGFQLSSDSNHNLSRIVNGRYAVTNELLGTTVHINTRTGEFEDPVDWSDALPGDATFTGEAIYDGFTDCIITFVNGAGPTLICGESCGEDGITLGAIVDDVCTRCGVPLEGRDVSELIQVVDGYSVMRNMSGRDAIEPLRPIAPFDSVESGTVIKFPVRGRDITKTYVTDELSAALAGENPPPAVTTEKVQSVELPRIVRLHYKAQTRDYEPGEKLSPSRFSPEVENELDVELPVAINDSMAAQVAEVIQSDAWVSRWTHGIAVDMSQLAREPTDVVLLPVDGRLYRARIVESNDIAGGLLRRFSLVRDDDGAYVSTAVSDPPFTPVITGPVIISDSALLVLDLPPLREEDDNAGMYAVVYRTNPNWTWKGANIMRSNDSGATWNSVAASTVEGTVGTLLQVLGNADPATWDTANEIIVEMNAGSFESRDDTSLFNGANAVAVGSHGRWEIVQFRDAEFITPTTMRLTRLLRGRRGTEVNIGTSQEGDVVVLLSDGSPIRLPLQQTDINVQYGYRVTSIGLAISEDDEQDFTGAGQALEPWAPTNISGARDGGDNLTITFKRRSRLGSDLTPVGMNLPLTETPEAYEIDVYDGSTVVRTIDTAVESAAYSAADQTTDFGSPQDEIAVKIYQISTITGRGLAGEATI